MINASTRMRASDADRQAAADRLSQQVAAGTLTVDEYDTRVARAYAAEYRDEFAPLFADLPGTQRAAGQSAASKTWPWESTSIAGSIAMNTARDRATAFAGDARKFVDKQRGNTHPLIAALAVIGALMVAGFLLSLLVPVVTVVLVVMVIVAIVRSRSHDRRSKSLNW